MKSFLKKIKFLLEKNKHLIAVLIGIKCCLRHGFKAGWKKYNNFKPIPKKEIRKLFTITPEERTFQTKYIFTENIKFSVLVPLYNTPKKYLIDMIESVQKQTYQNWELCLADGSDDEHLYVETTCLELAENDKRIKYKKLKENKGISENTNECIKMSTGDFIALFDHDDILHPSALFECMTVICEQGAEYVFTDETTFIGDDLTDIASRHHKPVYSFDNLIANNFICHFSVFKKSLIDKVGMFRHEYDGSQDHDIILRLTDAANKVVRIPKILYFWRSHKNSVAMDINSKTYAIKAGQNAVHDFLESKGLKNSVSSSPAFPTIYKIKYEITGSPKVSIIIPNKNGFKELKCCVESIIEKTTYPNYEIVIMDLNSDDENTLNYYKEITNDNIKVIPYDKKYNHSAICNYAAAHSDGEHLLFLESDTKIINPDWIDELVMYSQRKDVGAVGAKIYLANNTIQHAGIILGMGDDGIAGYSHSGRDRNDLGYMGRLFYAQNVSAVTSTCMMISREKFNKIGGFDEELSVTFNDVDICLRLLEHGMLNVFNPFCELYHYEISGKHQNTDEQTFDTEKRLFLHKWQKVISQGDPYYNPNFSLYDSYQFIK